MRFDLRPSAKAVAFGACLAICFAGQDRADAQGDAKAGRAKAESVCGVCHGVDGLAKIPEAPNLAGQSENYLNEQINAFKSGERKNEMMSVVVQDLSDADIENLAAYYSGIEISVKAPVTGAAAAGQIRAVSPVDKWIAILNNDRSCCAGAAGRRTFSQPGNKLMGTVTTKDGTEIFYKDWGAGEPIFFHHGWPLSADDWDAQMMFFLAKGYRVIAHDRRGHGRSTQTAAGHDMDTYADDAHEVVKKLDLKNTVHIGHSTGGGEVTRYVARHGKGRVKKAVLISSIPPLFMKTEKNPDGVPKEVVDGIRDGTANHRSQFYKDITIPFYGFNRPGAKISEGIRDNWWRQGMMGSIQAQYECVRVLSETEFYEDLAKIDVPVLVMHGEDDQICPFPTTGARSVKLLKHGTLKSYPGLPHGMPTTHADQINADLLAFIQS